MDKKMIRYLTLLEAIPRYPRRIDAGTLHRRLDAIGIRVSLRTIQRDLDELSCIFPLQCDEAKPKRWWFGQDATLLFPTMDIHTALTFALVQQYLHNLLPPSTLSHLSPWFKMARGIIETDASSLMRWTEKIRVVPHTVTRVPAASDPQIQSTLYDGLLQSKQVEVTYRAISTNAEAKTYPLHPLGLVFKDLVVYLVCTIRDYNAPRHLVLHRIQAARLLEDDARIPPQFDLDAYVQNEFGIRLSQTPLALRLRVQPRLRRLLEETPLAVGQRITQLDEDWALVEVAVVDTLDLRGWLGSLGAQAVVEGPDGLREEMLQSLAELNRLYGTT